MLLTGAALQGSGAAGQDGSFGPNGLRHFEQSLAALDGAPLDTAAKFELLTRFERGLALLIEHAAGVLG